MNRFVVEPRTRWREARSARSQRPSPARHSSTESPDGRLCYLLSSMNFLGDSRRSGTAFELRVLGFSVSVRWSFFACIVLPLAAGRTALASLMWVALAFVSVLAHELGHALLARRFGETPTISLEFLGGWTRADTASWTAAREFAYVLAGPLASVAFGALGLAAHAIVPADRSALVGTMLSDAVWCGFGWGLLNLVPVLPQDGAHLARALLGRRMRDPVTPFEIGASFVVLCALVLAFARSTLVPLKYQLIYVLSLVSLHVSLAREADEAKADEAHEGALSAMSTSLATLNDDAVVADGEALLPKLRSRTARWRALGMIARAHHHAKRYQLGVEAIDRLPVGSWADETVTFNCFIQTNQAPRAVAFFRERLANREDPNHRRLLLSSLTHAAMIDEALATDVALLDDRGSSASRQLTMALFDLGRIHDAVAWLLRSFARFEDNVDAYDLACGYARLGQNDEAVRWLHRAIDGGYTNRAHLEADGDLEPIRGRADVQALIARIAPTPTLAATTLTVKSEGPKPRAAVAFSRGSQ